MRASGQKRKVTPLMVNLQSWLFKLEDRNSEIAPVVPQQLAMIIVDNLGFRITSFKLQGPVGLYEDRIALSTG